MSTYATIDLLKGAVAIVLGLIVVYVGLFIFTFVAQWLGWDRE